MKSHQVIIAGAGPTGMMLAAELKLASIDVAIIEPRLTPELSGARAGGRGLHPRTLEVFDMRGIVDRFLAEGQKVQTVGFNMVILDVSDFPTRYPHGLALLQKRTERIIAGWIDEVGVKVYRGLEVTGFAQDDAGVTIDVSNGDRMRAEYLVGCDGGRSIVRKVAGIGLTGYEATMSWLIAEARMTETPRFGFTENTLGHHAMGPVDDRVGIVLTEPRVRPRNDRTLEDLREQLVAAYGTDFGVHSPNYISSFTDAARMATTYRQGRVLLAGDAAHVHPPVGGQGLNIGVQDALNLGWKLAQVVKGISSDALLESYERERAPIAARVLKSTVAQTALRRVDDRAKAVGDYVTEMLKTEDVRKRVGAELSGLGIRYDFGDGHPLLGRAMPDVDLLTTEGPRRVYDLLREPKPVLIVFGESTPADIAPWSQHVRSLAARYEGPWEVPVVGAVPAPGAVLIRPDGYVAWVGDRYLSGLSDAMGRVGLKPSPHRDDGSLRSGRP